VAVVVPGVAPGSVLPVERRAASVSETRLQQHPARKRTHSAPFVDVLDAGIALDHAVIVVARVVRDHLHGDSFAAVDGQLRAQRLRVVPLCSAGAAEERRQRRRGQRQKSEAADGASKAQRHNAALHELRSRSPACRTQPAARTQWICAREEAGARLVS
jgi:hypothetical protein